MQHRVIRRVRGLGAFRRALADLALAGEPLDARRRLILVPTRAAGELLRQTLEVTALTAGCRSLILPDIVTREEWVGRLHEALAGTAPLLSRVEREVLLERAARRTAVAHPLNQALFELRPGLVAAILDFYDEVRRRQRTARRSVRALFDELRVERGSDRGSEHLIQQTRYLGFTFLAYERSLAEQSGLDEHAVRARLIAEQPGLPFDHLIVAVADHPSDPRGLWPADFDLVGRLAAFSRIDIVVTDEAHDAGFRQRLEQELPGIEEVRAADVPRSPDLLRPEGQTDSPVFVCRDREEELRSVTRAIRRDAEATGGELRESVAVVFQRPLPYLYLAQQVLSEARVPYQAFDALPLAAEPYAALLDLVMDVARTGGTREAMVALLRSTLLGFEVAGCDLVLADVTALDAVLADRRAVGDATTYPTVVEDYFRSASSRRRESELAARRAADAAVLIHERLRMFRTAESGADQIGTIATFLRDYERPPQANDSWRERHLRARGAVLSVLDELAAAYERHDNRTRDANLLTATIHHLIETRTFTPRRGASGVHLVDAVAARFGEFDHVHVVGLVETDWPERMKRGIFYSTGLLKTLGWPQQTDQMRAEQAAFRDLMGLPAKTLRLSAFQLEGDAVVALSPLVEYVRDARSIETPPATSRPLFADELLTRDGPTSGLDAEPSAWLAVRRQRPPLTDPAYCGVVEAQAPQAYRVSRVDRYIDCPFKYFAESVLRLPDERDEMAGLTPLERGTLLHELFERFYAEWQGGGRGAITPETLPEAVALFAQLTHGWLERLPEADRSLEEARLLGSIVGLGVADRVFELEADSGARVRERRLECDVRGPFRFPVLNGLAHRTIEIRGKADRIDILDDGSLRVVDYKLGRMPDLKSSLQIAVYAYAASQMIEAEDGRPHPVSSAMYLAFGDERRLDGGIGGSSDPVGMAVETRAGEFAATVARIEAGEFPPRPKRPNECQWCSYAGVCRKEYQAEDDEATDTV